MAPGVDSCYLERLETRTSIRSAVKQSTVQSVCSRPVGPASLAVAPCVTSVCVPRTVYRFSSCTAYRWTHTTKLASAETATMPDQDLASKYMDLPQQGLASMAHTPPYAQPLGYQQPPTPGYNPPSYGFPPMYPPQTSYPGYPMGSYLASQCPSPSVDG